MNNELPEMAEDATPPEIPQVPEEIRAAVSALANAAFLFRGVFTQAGEGKPVDEILTERGPSLLMAEKVIDAWCEHLGIEPR